MIVRSEGKVLKMIPQMKKHIDPIDILVNNAGTTGTGNRQEVDKESGQINIFL